MKAYSYIRFSTPEQALGDSLRRQLQAAHQWCSERGLELDDSLRDLGRSAYRGAHAEFGALGSFLELVKSGQVPRGSYLLVESLDRLSRETVIDAAMRLLDLIRSGITVVTLSDNQEYSEERLRTDWTPLIVSISIMARAHEESRIKGQRVEKAWAEKRRKATEHKQAMTAICPGWVRLVGGPKTGRYELIPERAAIVSDIFRDTISGLGRRAIANKLNANNSPRWGIGAKAGLRWHDSYIQKILQNPACYGRAEPLSKRSGGDGFGTVAIDGYFPAVVDENTFYLAQAASQSRGSSTGRPSKTHRNLLRGLAKCASCGSNLVIIDKGKRSAGPKLICGSAHARSGCNDRSYHLYSRIELHVLILLASKRSELLLSSKSRLGGLRADREALMARQESTRRRLDNLVEMVAVGGQGKVVAGQVSKLEIEVEAIEIAIKALDRDIASTEATAENNIYDVNAIRSQFEELDGEDLIRARATVAERLKMFIDKVEVSPEVITVWKVGGGILGRVQSMS